MAYTRKKREHSMEVYEAILHLENEEECYNFFKDVCSETEILAMEQRYQVARMLEEGYTYLEIQNETNASSSTISRVGRMLDDGTKAVPDLINRLGKENDG